MSCENAYFGGWGSCASLMEKMNGGALQLKGTTWTDATAEAAATWRSGISIIATASRNTLMLPILSFENTTDDVEITTTQLGKKSITSKPIPSGMIALDASLCDYKQLYDMEDTWYEFIPSFQGGAFWYTRKTDGTLKGFRCKVGFKAGLPPEDKSLSYPMYLFFDNVSEFENVVVVQPAFNFSDILDYSPVGLDIRVTTAYTDESVTVKVTKRGTGDPMLSLVAGDFTVLRANGTPVTAVTALTDNGLGSYTLVLVNDSAGTPVGFSVGNYAVLQAHDDDATYITYLSHAIKITREV